MKNVHSVMRASRDARCIIGLGGGKSVDVGKLAASKLNLPFFSVPTSASHDGIASPFASIRGTDKHYSIKAKPPLGILADVEVIAAAPPRLFAAGCGDLVAEAYRRQGTGSSGTMRRESTTGSTRRTWP